MASPEATKVRSVASPEATKVFNDPVHGHMEFPPLCVAIMDTPEFQRLRYLKQLGGGYFVYPDASHNRFEHSLGVSHLAGLLVNELRNRQPELGIKEEDVLCVQIAGLCHDLGHGPFSHVFDNKFIAKQNPDRKWKHEEASLAMFDHLVEKNQLKKGLQREKGLTTVQIETIKELIIGKDPSGKRKPEWTYKSKLSPTGRPVFQNMETWTYTGKKAFLYEIVANKRNGVDVDKWDYFQRDCHHLGMTSSFDLKRFIKFARVITVKGENQICYRDKEAFNMYQLFHTRFTLHRRAYQHKTVQAVELMLVDAMIAADTPGKPGEEPISKCIDDMDTYTHLTDDIFHQILRGDTKGAESHKERAKKILEDIQKRNLYECVGEIVVPLLPSKYEPKKETSTEEEIETEIRAVFKETDFFENKIRIQVSTLDYGNKAENPVDNVRFYKKTKTGEPVTVAHQAVEVSFLVPQFCFREELVRVFYVKSDQNEKPGRTDEAEEKTANEKAADEKEAARKEAEDKRRIEKIMKDWCDEKRNEKTKWCGDQKEERALGKKRKSQEDVSERQAQFEGFVEHVYQTFCPTFRSMLPGAEGNN